MSLPSQMAVLPPPQSTLRHCSPQLPQWDDPSLSEQTPTLLGLVRSYSILRCRGQSKQRGRDSTVKNCCVKSMEETRVGVMRGGGRVKLKLSVCKQKGKVNQLVEEKGAEEKWEIVVSLQGSERVVGHWT